MNDGRVNHQSICTSAEALVALRDNNAVCVLARTLWNHSSSKYRKSVPNWGRTNKSLLSAWPRARESFHCVLSDIRVPCLERLSVGTGGAWCQRPSDVWWHDTKISEKNKRSIWWMRHQPRAFPFLFLSLFHTKPVVGETWGFCEEHNMTSPLAACCSIAASHWSRCWFPPLTEPLLAGYRKETNWRLLCLPERGRWFIMGFCFLFQPVFLSGCAHTRARAQSFKPTRSAFRTVMLRKLVFPKLNLFETPVVWTSASSVRFLQRAAMSSTFLGNWFFFFYLATSLVIASVGTQTYSQAFFSHACLSSNFTSSYHLQMPKTQST